MLNRVLGNESVKKDLLKLKDKIPPVIIFNGPPKIGKIFTAYNFIDEIYNLQSRLYTHPDIQIFESDTLVFKIELINKLRNSVLVTPFEIDKKFFLLRNVDTMNKESFNRILKILEDRNSTDYFILTCKNLDNLPKTVVSRSVVFNFLPILNLKEYFPQLTDLQLKLMQGCPGNFSLIEKLDLTNLYELIKNLLISIKILSYAEILEKYSLLKNIDKEILINLINIVALDIMSLETIEALKKLREKLEFTLFPDMHIKNMFLFLKE